MSLDAATVLLQWATGGLLFCWVTTRHREVGLGYGWLLRGTYAALAAGAVVGGVAFDAPVGVTAAAAGVVLATLIALASSVLRKEAGVAGQRAEHDRRSARVAAMTGIQRDRDYEPDPATSAPAVGSGGPAPMPGSVLAAAPEPPEFNPALDLVAPIIGMMGLIASGLDTGIAVWLAVARTLVGAAFLGAITDAMLLGHWYLVQPGLPRKLLVEQVRWVQWIWPVEVALLLVPVGMVAVLTGEIDDGWNGILGWTWVMCAVTTIGLVITTRAALKERAYSAVMAATGLLYLAILTAFGTDLVARAVLAP